MVHTRPVHPEDEPFLLAVYSSSRLEELATVGWSPDQVQAFCLMQFRCQTLAYQRQFPDADHRIVLHEEHPAGRILIDRSPEELRLVDITLLPEFRNRGLGTGLIRSLQAEAAEAGVPMRLTVLSDSPAHGLYERLGFTVVRQHTAHCAMEWRAPDFASTR